MTRATSLPVIETENRPPRYEFERKIWQYTRTLSYQQEPPQTMRLRRHRFIVIRPATSLVWQTLFDANAEALGSSLEEMVSIRHQDQQPYFFHDPIAYSRDTRVVWQGIDQHNMQLIIGEGFAASDFEPIQAENPKLITFPSDWDFRVNIGNMISNQIKAV